MSISDLIATEAAAAERNPDAAIKPGSKVNLEIDLIARYCERLLTAEQELSA